MFFYLRFDKTLKGYCVIEDAAKLPDVPKNIRELNHQGFHLEKFLVNACMYLACGDQDENIQVTSSFDTIIKTKFELF
jgi:hypothetical protein